MLSAAERKYAQGEMSSVDTRYRAVLKSRINRKIAQAVSDLKFLVGTVEFGDRVKSLLVQISQVEIKVSPTYIDMSQFEDDEKP